MELQVTGEVKKSKGIGWWLLVALVVCGVLSRAVPIGYGLAVPGAFSADEIDVVSRALKMGSGDLLPIHANKPTAYNAVVMVCYGFWYLWMRLTEGLTLSGFERMFYLQPAGFYLLARAVSVAAAVGTFLLLVYTTRRLGMLARFCAVAVMALGVSSVHYGHIAKEDTIAAFFAFASLVAVLEALGASDGSKRRSLWLVASALAGGLAISSKYNTVFFALFAVIGWWQGWQGSARWKWLSVMAIAGVAGLVIGTPFIALQPGEFLRRTLASPVAHQVVGAYNILSYDDHRGVAFTVGIFLREFGPAVLALAVGIALFLSCGKDRVLILVPTTIYTAVLFKSGQLDYQYILPLTPLLALGLARGVAATPMNKPVGWVATIAFLAVLAMIPWNGSIIARRTVEALGEDTRITAARWIEEHSMKVPADFEKPILCVSGYYFQYHPAIALNAESFLRLERETIERGGAGRYFQGAARFAVDDPRMKFSAAFIAPETGFIRHPDGTREFLPQPISTNLADYQGQYSLLVIPSNTMDILGYNAPELEDVNQFLRSIQELPLLTKIEPQPWKTMGPTLWIYQFR